MKCEPGKCFKCGNIIARDGKMLSNYKQVGFNIQDNVGEHILEVAFCKDCNLNVDEYDEALSALKGAMGPVILDGAKIVGVNRERSMVDFVSVAQGGLCQCGAKLDKKAFYDGKKLLCRKCVRPELDIVGDKGSTPGKLTRERNKNVQVQSMRAKRKRNIIPAPAGD